MFRHIPGPAADDAGRCLALRWVGSGWTVFNNKGKPVRQYEPFFDESHRSEFDARIGVSRAFLPGDGKMAPERMRNYTSGVADAVQCGIPSQTVAHCPRPTPAGKRASNGDVARPGM